MQLTVAKGMVRRGTAILVLILLIIIVLTVLYSSRPTKSRLGSILMKSLATDLNTTAAMSKPVSTNASAFSGRLITSVDQLGINMKSISCVTAKNSGMSFPICVYGAREDHWVSRSFIYGGYFEGGTVSRMLRLLRRYPGTEFVDLGANIGTFTLPASRITHVVAVEPYSETMVRLLKSVKLGAVEHNVSLVFNAISNERSKYQLGFYPGNVGGTYLKVASATNCSGGPECATTETILLNDLLPLMRGRRAVLKVDVEGHQHQVFTEETAGKFFELVDVPLVYMEWTNLCRRLNIFYQVQSLMAFFSVRKYDVFSGDNNYVMADCSHWSSNILFRKLSVEF